MKTNSYLKERRNWIKKEYNEDTILIEDLNLNILEKIMLFFSKKEIIVFNNDRFGYHPSITIKRFKNQKILLNFKEGSGKELL